MEKVYLYDSRFWTSYVPVEVHLAYLATCTWLSKFLTNAGYFLDILDSLFPLCSEIDARYDTFAATGSATPTTRQCSMLRSWPAPMGPKLALHWPFINPKPFWLF